MLGRITVVAALILAAPASAHDFWLQPVKFILPAPANVPMLIYVGHGAARDRWALSADRVVLFNSTGPDGLVDRKNQLTLGSPRFDAFVPLAKAGSYVFAFQSMPSSSDLPFARFNDYLTEEGVSPIIDHRRRMGTERQNGRESYSRRAKAIVQVGPVDAVAIARATRPIGLKLEIVPEIHPNTLKPGQSIPIRIYFNKRPLAGAFVKLTNLGADEKPVATKRSDNTGRASFVLPARGSWQFNVIWAEVPKGNGTDYVTVFSSLTFGL